MRLLLPLLAVLTLSACNDVPVLHSAVPEAASADAVVEGFDGDIRFWADEAPKDFDKVVAARLEQYTKVYAGYYDQHHEYPPLSYLAISGGAYDGAFGAGLLSGWTEHGDRPDFALVTGVSTGALIAPFAFIGPKYDGELKTFFTKTRSDNIFAWSVWKVVAGLSGGLAVTDNSPLAKRIEQVITPQVLAEIAEQNKRGKQLLIGTTNVEAQRGVIWDIGKIASSGNPGALKLVHQIMLASASVPGLFKPVFIHVTAGGVRYDEIHADGGITSQVFAYPMKLNRSIVEGMKRLHLQRDLYIVRNSKITPEYQAMQPGIFSLTARSVETLIKYQGLGDLYRLYVSTQRDGVGYHLATIPASFHSESKELFDPDYMGALFDVGYRMGGEPRAWAQNPPGVVYMDVPAKDAKPQKTVGK